MLFIVYVYPLLIMKRTDRAGRRKVAVLSARHRIISNMALVIFIWGCTATAETVALRTLSPMQLTLWSTMLGAGGAFALSAARGRMTTIFSFAARDHLVLFALAQLGFAGYFFLKYTAYVISPIPQANALQYTFTVFIVIFAVPVLKQPLTRWKIVAVLTGFTGAAVIITGGGIQSFEAAHLPGYCLALGAGASFGLFSVLCDRSGFDRMGALFFFHAYSALTIFTALLLTGDLVFPGNIVEIGGAFYSGVVSNVIGMYLWLSAQNESRDVSVLTGLLYFVPFVSLLSFRLFLGIGIPLSAYCGLLLIVGGMSIHTARSVAAGRRA